MGNYKLFIFDEEVARKYYSQESKLFYLFVEHDKATGTQKEIINKQIEYITKPVPVLRLQQKLKKSLRHAKGYEYTEDKHIINLFENGSRGELVLGKEVVHLFSTGEEFDEVETMFFEVLRKCEPTFFAVSLDRHRYGWLKPLKQDIFLS